MALGFCGHVFRQHLRREKSALHNFPLRDGLSPTSVVTRAPWILGVILKNRLLTSDFRQGKIRSSVSFPGVFPCSLLALLNLWYEQDRESVNMGHTLGASALFICTKKPWICHRLRALVSFRVT